MTLLVRAPSPQIPLAAASAEFVPDSHDPANSSRPVDETQAPLSASASSEGMTEHFAALTLRPKTPESTKNEPPSATRRVLSMPSGLQQTLDAASELLNADRPSDAARLLATEGSRTPEAGLHYAFHTRYATALLGHVDSLNNACKLGAVSLASSIVAGKVQISEVSAERVGCYVGVCASYNQALRLLAEPEIRESFVAKNSEQTLLECQAGMQQGLVHAIVEIRLFVNRLAQCNSNRASADFVTRMLDRGVLSANDPSVVSFREVQKEPFYDAFVALGHGINASIEKAGEAPTLVWLEWAAREKQRLSKLSEIIQAHCIPEVAETLDSFRQHEEP